MAIRDARESAEATLANLREAPTHDSLGRFYFQDRTLAVVLRSASLLQAYFMFVEAWSSLSEQEIQCAVRPEWLRFAPDTKHKHLSSPQYTLFEIH